MERRIANPFIVGKYISSDYFCDREEETLFVQKQMDNGRNLAMISPRRMGKSGLIEHYFAQPSTQERYYTLAVDIYATQSFSEFVYMLGKSIYEQLKPKKTAWTERFFQIISSLRVGFRLDSQTGDPSFDISLGDIQTPQTTLDEIFDYLESADRPCIVAIDEFQQIENYSEKNVEAMLRTKIQRCKQTQFIFAGSKRHLMGNMFNSPAKPFYQSAIIMGLQPIPLSAYSSFALRLFADYQKKMEPEVVETVYHRFEGCTWFIQMIMNELFANTPVNQTCTLDMLPTAIDGVIARQDMSYQEQLANLPLKQKQLLQAIAKEGRVSGITSGAFVKKHKLSSPRSIQAALKPLLKADIVTADNGQYRIYDYFFATWLAEKL